MVVTATSQTILGLGLDLVAQSLCRPADQAGLAPVVFPGFVAVPAVGHAAPASAAGVGTIQEQPAAACIFALTDQAARS